MSDNGPYTQPPQYPQGDEGGNSGGQSAQGGGYQQPGPGEANTGGQQPHPGGPYQPGPGAPNAPQPPPNGPYQPGPGDPNAQPPYPSGPYQGGYDPNAPQQYPSGPYPAVYGPATGGHPPYQQPPYGNAAQPGPGGPQFPPQQAFQQGGQPPYGPPGGPGMPGYPPPPAPRKSNAGLWIVLAGGAVIMVLVVAVMVMLIRGSGGGTEVAPADEGVADSQQQDDSQQSDSQGGEQDEQDDTQSEGGQGEGDGQAAGEPPYAIPEEPCKAITEDKAAEIGASDPSKNISNTISSCYWSVEGEDGTYGSLNVTYEYPYGGSDSVEGAKETFQTNLEYATDESGDYSDIEVHENQDVNIGDEGKLIFATNSTVTKQSVGTLLIREENVNITVEYSMSPDIMASDPPPPLEFSDVESLLPELGKQTLNIVGSA
ncbi:hypothetical protein [Salinactinospora qingdaonensis]|uniref:DUF3558 domain-containing protein n=1 Tax=Salinactinospora qingdaonensis TaxID=702744 RepID=A0ABP7FC77_9ACTN